MTLRRRLEALEANKAARPPEGFPNKNLEQYFRALENDRRERAGVALLEMPYNEEDYYDDMRVIASLRTDPGWDTEQGRMFLDEWENAAEKSLEKGKSA